MAVAVAFSTSNRVIFMQGDSQQLGGRECFCVCPFPCSLVRRSPFEFALITMSCSCGNPEGGRSPANASASGCFDAEHPHPCAECCNAARRNHPVFGLFLTQPRPQTTPTLRLPPPTIKNMVVMGDRFEGLDCQHHNVQRDRGVQGDPARSTPIHVPRSYAADYSPWISVVFCCYFPSPRVHALSPRRAPLREMPFPRPEGGEGVGVGDS